MSMLREWSSFSESNIVVESVKDRDGDKSCYLKGVFIQAEKKNLNERVYPLREITNAVSLMQERLDSGESILVECDHPDTLTVNIDNVAGMITEIKMNGSDGVGTIKLLPTTKGENIRKMIEAGVKFGVSSRGSGSVDDYGNVSDFEIVTVDIVAQPSAPDAYPQAVFESLFSTTGYGNSVSESKYNSNEVSGSFEDEIRRYLNQ